ncbi:MAG: tRNA lysidine(34) synthetase TilS [Tyzzerella sp.]|nr:tRNA lysidine(34) synthetase TilS [Tyzzerella sp.]
MLKKIEEYAAKWHMLEKEDKVIAGVSGGADSICLLFVLLELQKKIPFELIAVHVNHGLRGEAADADEAYVKEICRQQNILCLSYSENVELIAKNRKQSTEEAGRDIRREAFQRALEQYGGTKIALAHHKNDNVETFFMNLARGTGIKGMGGIRPVAGNIIRPLLCVERSEIEQYLQDRKISYCIDQTNATDDYTRNRIRNNVIPYLESEVNAQAVSHIDSAMEQLRELQVYIEEQVNQYFGACVKEQGTGYLVAKEEFEKSPKIFQSLVLKKVLVQICKKEKDMEAVHLKDLQELFGKQVGRKVDLPYGMEGRRVYEGLSIREKSGAETDKKECQISCKVGEKQEIFCGSQKITCRIFEKNIGTPICLQKGGAKWFDYGIIASEICVRTRRPGDYISIHSSGKKQKLKSFFINEKIPQEKRDEILLVADGNHILWIVGYRTNPAYQVTEHTKHVLEIQMDKGENYGREN